MVSSRFTKKVILIDQDFNFKVLQNARMNPLSTAERTALADTLNASHAGLLVYDTSLNSPLFWTGSAFSLAPTAPYFTKLLPDALEIEVLPIEHGLATINNVKVLNPSGYAVEVLEKISSNALYLYSNISLDNHQLIIS